MIFEEILGNVKELENKEKFHIEKVIVKRDDLLKRIMRVTSAAIKGMMNYLSDDYSVYFTEEEKQSFNERLNGVYTGLGVEITNDSSNNAMVVTVFDLLILLCQQ